MDMITAQGPLSVGAHKPLPELAGIGHNNPPTPYEALKAHIDDLYEEAVNFLDGDPIATEEQAAAVSKLKSDASAAKRATEAQRKLEVKPFDDGKAEVQARYNPLVKDKIGRCDLIIATCSKALAPYLQKLEDEQRAVAEAARVEAEEKAAAARIAAQTVAPDDLAAQARLAELREESEAAQKAATKAGKAKAHASGGERAVGLRKRWIPTITDRMAVLKHYMLERPGDLAAWLADQVERDNRVAKRDVPGVTYTEETYAQ